MQPPQDPGIDWSHGITSLISVAFGAVSGFVVSIWRVARIEPSIRVDFQTAVSEAEKRVEDKIDAAQNHGEAKVEEMVGHFHESFTAMRQQINTTNERLGGIELDSERRFLPKGEFIKFVDEYRQDMRRIFDKLDNLPNGRQK